jgi:hypothetical protein
MFQIIGFILLLGLAVFAIKLALICLLLGGLIFRTQETIGIIAILAILAGFNAHPGIGLTLLVLGVIVSLYYKRKGRETVESDD